MAAIKARGETAFPEAGEGVILRYRNSDLKQIEAEHGPEWFQSMIDTFLRGIPSITFILGMVQYGAKKGGVPYEVPEDILDDIPVHDLADKIFDAACLSMKGLPAKEYLEETFARHAEMEAKGEDPSPPSPDTTS